MSLPNYLASIKSAGFYRFVWDKSQVPAETAQTMRLVVGYSEKGPFNTPVYVDKASDFKTIFGGINKKLERKGVYFHRMALQALTYGPILALNVKPFTEPIIDESGKTTNEANLSKLTYYTFDSVSTAPTANTIEVSKLYNTEKFWTIEADDLISDTTKYITIAHTGDSSASCNIFMKDYEPDFGYDLSVEEYYNNLNEEVPFELEAVKAVTIKKFFAEIYVFKNLASVEADEQLEVYAQDSSKGFIGKYQGCLLPNFKDTMGNYISLDIIFNKDTYNHKCLMKIDNEKLTAEVLNVLEKISTYSTTLQKDIPLNLTMTGYNYTTPTDPWSAVKEMLEGNAGVGIREALTNRKDVDYHYIVDTFDTPSKGDKKVLATICKEKQNAFALLNFPKMKTLETTGDYKNTLGKFDTKSFISNKPIAIPTEAEGASYCAYFTQLVLSDGTVKTTIPSAALVSNNFMEKWNSRQPYYIVAGPNYGRMDWSGLVGPDYNFARKDLDVLEPLGINAMVYVPRKGTYINSNQTIKQTPVSALSKIHVRELVIYLQNEIETMLSNYQWELNTQVLRDVVKSKADTILETVKNNGGVYAYINICDSTNNTPEVIDNEMLVLSTEIEPARGAGKMVQEITIHRTGGLTTR